MDVVDGSAAREETVNASRAAPCEPEVSAYEGDDGGSVYATEKSRLTPSCAESSLRLEAEPCGGARLAAIGKVSAAQLPSSSPAVVYRPGPGGTPLQGRNVAVDSASVRGSLAAGHLAIPNIGSACEGPVGSRMQLPSMASLTVNSACTSNTTSTSTVPSQNPRSGLACGRTALVLGQEAPVQSEQASLVPSQASTTPTGFRVVSGRRVPIGAVTSPSKTTVADDPQRTTPAPNAGRQVADRGENSSPLLLPPGVERTSATSANSERSATAAMQEDITPPSSASCERHEGVGELPPVPMPCADGDERRSCSLMTSERTSPRFRPVHPDGQAAGAKRNSCSPALGRGYDGLGAAVCSGSAPAMTTEGTSTDATGGCLIDRGHAVNGGQRVDNTLPADAATSAVNDVETMASATLGHEGATACSKRGLSASPKSRRVGRDAAGEDAAGEGSVSGAAQLPEEPGPASAEPSTNGLLTPMPNVAVARTPLRVLSAASSPPSAHSESSYNVAAPGTTASRDRHSDSGVTVPGRQAGEPPTDAYAMSPSAEHYPQMSRGEKHTRLEASMAPECAEGIAGHDSVGDTADVALAAFSYANALAEEGSTDGATCSTAARLRHDSSGEPVQSVSIGASGGASVPPAGQTHAMAISTADGLAMSRGPSQEEPGFVAGLSAAIVVGSDGLRAVSRATSTCEAASQVKTASESISASASVRSQGGGGSSGLAKAAKGVKRSRSKSDHHDDLMHAMCMICLETLSDAGEGGGAKLLGLLDSCSHRYCYTCILEWSKITNKCPQCKARFHTIKAVKELRRKNERYRGVAVRVEDRDQVYSFVDVRDVVVLDPGVACHVGCLVRRGVDALQQGWEFSVQCEQCSKWYHGLCVGFRQEWQVPDLWFCRPCRGESYQIVLNPDAITEPAAIVDRGRASPGGSRSENRGQDGGDSREGTLDVPPSLSAQGGSGEVASGGTQGHEVRNAVSSAPGIDTTALERLQETDSTSYAGVPSAGVAETQQPPVSAATPALGAPVQSPSSSLTPVETAPGGSYTSSSNLPPLERMGTSLDARQQEPAASPPASSPAESTSNLSGAPHQARAMPSPSNASPTPPTPAAANSAPFVFPQVAVPRVRGRGRPRGSRKKTTGSQPSQAPRQTSANPTMTAPPRPGAGAPARPRGRPRGSKNKPKPPAPAQPTAGPPVPTIPAPQPERRSPSPTPAESPASPPRGQRQQRPQQEQAGDGEETPVEDVLPQPPEPPSPSMLQSLEASSVTDLCEICGFDTEPDNLIVYCESCNMGVHQTCYGISEIPTKEWYCSPCSAGVHPSTLACRFCPVKGGALKRCTDDSWGHILCAFWIPECCFIDPQKMEPIGSINRRGQAGGVETFLPSFRSRKCYICGTSAGSAIRCHSASCKFHLHPMCGSKAGSVYMEIETTMKRGADATEHESVSLVAKCPRHNKTKAGSGRPLKGRPTTASATDPLSVLGKTLEITDPERGGSVALVGKVTWYNPNRSRYCVVTARPVGDDDARTGSGEPQDGCSHWITVDKLIEVGAMGVLKDGKRFPLEPLPAFEEEETLMDAESAYQDNESQAEGNSEEQEEPEGSGVLSSEDGGKKEDTVVNVEETASEQEKFGTTVGKRRRIDAPVPPIGSPDASAAKRAARVDSEFRQAALSPGFNSEPPQPIPGVLPVRSPHGESSPSLMEYRVGSDAGTEDSKHAAGTETRSAAARCPIQQQDRLLPSVQITEENDPFSRYPIRGRLRRQTLPAFEEPRALERMPSVKRQRRAGEVDPNRVITVDAGSDSSSATDQACTGEAKVTGACLGSTASASSDQTRVHQKSLPLPSTPARTVSIEPHETHETHERGPPYNLEPGWPNGMQLLGQVPVMCVRAVRVRSDGDVMYYASAYKDAESVFGCRRSTPRFSFDFEGVEKLGLGVRGKHVRRQDAIGGSIDGHGDSGCQAAGKRGAREDEHSTQEQEGEGETQEDTGKREVQQGEAPRAPRDGACPTQNAETPQRGGKEAEDEALPDDGVEEGEIDASLGGNAGTMPPGRGEENNVDGDDERRGSMTGVRATHETAVSSGIPAQAATGNHSSVPGYDKHDVEEMEISSDDASYCGFEAVEAASSCISEDEASDADTHVATDRGPGGAAGGSNVGTKPSVPPLSGDRSAFLPSSPTATNKPETRAPIRSAADDEPTIRAESCSVSGVGKEMPAEEGELEMASVQPLPPRETEAVLSLRSIVRKQLQGVLRSASKGKEAALRDDGNDVIEEIADDTEEMLFRLLYKDSTGGREYKAKYKQLMLALGNVRNYRLVASVLAGSTTPADLATKDAVGLLNSLSSSLNCLAMPLSGRQRQGSQPCSPPGSSAGNSQKGKGKRRGKMQLLY